MHHPAMDIQGVVNTEIFEYVRLFWEDQHLPMASRVFVYRFQRALKRLNLSGLQCIRTESRLRCFVALTGSTYLLPTYVWEAYTFEERELAKHWLNSTAKARGQQPFPVPSALKPV